MVETKKHLIIGCGSAALSALEKIRSLNQEDEIKLVSMEDCLPYSPTALPYLLAGRVNEDNIWIKGEGYFEDMNANLLRGKEVVKIVPDKKQVIYSDGESEQYDNLLITTGSDSIKPKIRGLDDDIFLGFHTLEDYHKLVQKLSNKTKVVILGAGLVGMEVAASLSERGHDVIILEKENQILPLYFDQPASDYINDIFLEQGINIITGNEVIEIQRSQNGLGIICADSKTFHADVLIVCVGVASRISLLDGSGIKTNKGILVDSHMKTNIDGIYAAGDVAESIDFFTKKPGINAIIPSAVAQGKVAGSNMASEEMNFEGSISMNVFNFFGNMASSVGTSMPTKDSEQAMERDDKKNRYFKRFVFSGNNLIGAMFINEEVDPGVIRYLIENKVPIDDNKELLLNKTKEVSRWLMLKTEEAQTAI